MATIKDVARRAGVSVSTVSYVLSGSRPISDATREVVQSAISDLGYTPHAGARTLRGTASRVLALALPATSRSYHSIDGRFIQAISSAARAQDHDILLTSGGEGALGVQRIARSRLADAVILMAVGSDDARAAALHADGFPVVLIGRPDDPTGGATQEDDPGQWWTDLDFTAATALALDHLADLGHTDVLFLTSSRREYAAGRTYTERALAGALSQSSRRGTTLEVLHAADGVQDGESLDDEARDPAEEAVRSQARELLSRKDRPLAVVTHHPPAMAALLHEAEHLGLELGKDLSLIAVGSVPEVLPHPDVTRIGLPIAAMARSAVQLAVSAVRAGEDDEPVSRLIAPKLVLGSTTGPPLP